MSLNTAGEVKGDDLLEYAVIETERDLATYGEEFKFGADKIIHDARAGYYQQRADCRS